MESEEVDFLFNIIIAHYELLKDVPDPSKIDAMVKFAGNSMPVPNSLINVSDFDANQQLSFSKTPDDLRNALAADGVVVSLRYEKSSLGNAVISLPDTTLDKIAPGMNDILHEENVSIIRQKNSIGIMTVLFVLMIKCEDKEHDEHEERSSRKSTRESTRKSTRESTRRTSRKSRVTVDSAEIQLELPKKVEKEECSGLGPTLNPQDVLFVVGDPDPLLKIPDEPCSEPLSEEGDERLRLDLQRYEAFNRRAKFPADDPCPKPSLSQLRNLTQKYGKIIDSVIEKVKEFEVPTLDMLYEDKASPKETQEIGTQRYIPVPMESEDEYGVKPLRFCPVCLCSMSWMPKYSSCLWCNTRPRPTIHDQPMTASEIVAEQLVRPTSVDSDFCPRPCEAATRRPRKRLQPMVNIDSDAECPPCRCTCKDGKMCAHCRIRNLCEEIFQSENVQKKAELRAERLARYAVPRSSEDFSLIPGPEDDDRPYLYRVFSEMKSLYALHDSRKMNAIQRRCKSQTLLTMRSAPSLYQSQHHKDKLNFHFRDPSIPRQKAGHKHCLPPEPYVPRHHGWDWTRTREAKKYGWRPGSIMRAALHVMRFFLTAKVDPFKIIAEQEELQRQNSPLLNICKRNGEIFVTLRPLESLQMKEKPITFRIVKSHLKVALRQIKRALKDQGFEKCRCHKSLMLCTCRDALEKFELNKALRKECQRRLIEPCPEHLVLTDTSVSDLEFNLDIHRPSKSFRSKIKAIRNSVIQGTQTSKTDQLPPPPKYPMEVPPYYRGFDCAVGDRYMGTAFGLPGEAVFEDGVFGLAGGGPHGPNSMPCGVIRSANAWGGGGGGGMFAKRGRRGRGVSGGPGDLGAWKAFPGGKGRRGGKSGPIPVRYPKRFLKPAQDAARAAKEAERAALETKKKGPDMLKYLQNAGTLRRPWNPNEGKDTRPRPPKLTDKGPDGLNVFERKRRDLNSGPAPLISQAPRRAKGFHPNPDDIIY